MQGGPCPQITRPAEVVINTFRYESVTTNVICVILKRPREIGDLEKVENDRARDLRGAERKNSRDLLGPERLSR